MFENPRSLDVDRARGFETKIQTNGKEPFQKVDKDTRRYKARGSRGGPQSPWSGCNVHFFIPAHPRPGLLRLRRHVPEPPPWLHRKLRVCRLDVGDTSSGKGFRAVDDTARATRRLAGCGVEGRETGEEQNAASYLNSWENIRERRPEPRSAEGERDMHVGESNDSQGEVKQRTSADTAQPECLSGRGDGVSSRKLLVGRGSHPGRGGAAGLRRERGGPVRASWEEREDGSRGIDTDAVVLQTRPLLASDLDPPAPRRDGVACAPAPPCGTDPPPRHETRGRIIRAFVLLRPSSTTAVQGTQLPRTLPRAELDVDSSGGVHAMISICRSARAASTCEAMLRNAGAAPAPSLHMLMPHRKPPPPYFAPGVRWSREPRRERVAGQGRGRGRDGEDGLTAVGGQRDEVAVRRIWDGEVDGRGQGAASLQTSRNPYPPRPRRTESAAAAASQDPHGLGTNVTKTIRALMYSGAGAGRARIHVRMRGQGEAMAEEVDSEGAKDGESVIDPEADCVVDILLSFALLLNRRQGERRNESSTIYVMMMCWNGW
ncbi:hypothetical protein K438DRAFT_1945896 [Mycena galopus ATCC 62051]|nr:hypothetical protein K438DRAFT_1789141 [Mycena galopus ATCC 62051]KAF8143311.1 hypothetical protein K438DRAFT_1945896 [Mycena galopus ATCC 62051]